MTVTLMGGDMQAQGIAQVLLNVLDLGANLQAATDMARFRHMQVPNVLTLESQLFALVGAQLQAMGHDVESVNGDTDGRLSGHHVHAGSSATARRRRPAADPGLLSRGIGPPQGRSGRRVLSDDVLEAVRTRPACPSPCPRRSGRRGPPGCCAGRGGHRRDAVDLLERRGMSSAARGSGMPSYTSVDTRRGGASISRYSPWKPTSMSRLADDVAPRAADPQVDVADEPFRGLEAPPALHHSGVVYALNCARRGRRTGA